MIGGVVLQKGTLMAKRISIIFFVALLLWVGALAGATYGDVYEVCVGRASLWLEPSEPKEVFSFRGPLLAEDNESLSTHASQVLFGERVIFVNGRGDYLQVDVPGQLVRCKESGCFVPLRAWIKKNYVVKKEQSHMLAARHLLGMVVVNRRNASLFTWKKDYRGWVRSKVAYGAILKVYRFSEPWAYLKLEEGKEGCVHYDNIFLCDHPPKEDELRANFTSNLLECFNQLGLCYYRSGGRSVFDHSRPLSSFDDTGLVSLGMHALGCVVPRGIVDMYEFATPVSLSEIKKGDLVFLLKPDGGLYSVMVYLGGDLIIEVPKQRRPIATVSGALLFGRCLQTVENGSEVEYDGKKYNIFYRSFFADEAKMEQMRDWFLRATDS